MKKCPYCAEEIQDEAIFCRYCRRDLTKLVQTKLPDEKIATGSTNEPPILASLFFAFLIILLIDVSAIIFYLFFKEFSGLTLALGIMNLGTRIVTGIIGVYGYKPTGAKPINFLGMILLSFIPIGSWFTIYYAGKAFARKIPARTVLISLISIIGITGGFFFLASYGSSSTNIIQKLLPSKLQKLPKPSATKVVKIPPNPTEIRATQILWKPEVTNTPKGLLYFDNFSIISDLWYQGSSDISSFAYSDNLDGYYVTLHKPYYYHGTYIPVREWNSKLNNILIQTDLINADSTNDGVFGVTCRDLGDKSYAFVMGNNGFYGIGIRDNGTFHYLSSNYDRNSIIQPGRINSLEAECNGSTLALSINGYRLLDILDSTFDGYRAGLFVFAGQKGNTIVKYENITVKSPMIIKPRVIITPTSDWHYIPEPTRDKTTYGKPGQGD